MLLCELFQNKTLSPEFYEWFGDSKAVNADGSPMILYHGTSKDQDFKHFNIPKSGVWFATTPKGASDYAMENDSQNLVYDHMTGKYVHKHTASRVIPVYLKINNPKIYEGYPQEEIGHSDNYKKAAGIFFDKLRSEGYDSMIITHQGKPSVVALLVNDPSRIKSAISNKDYTHKKNIHEKASPQASAIVKAVLKNPKFKKWFGKSKIVDEHGLPMVVYHGTASAFDAFKAETIGKVFNDDKHGFFFTNNAAGNDMASGYAKRAATSYDQEKGEWRYDNGTPNVIPAFVKIENPYTFMEYGYAYEYGEPTDKASYHRMIEKIMDGRGMVDWFDTNKHYIIQRALEGGHDGIFLFDPTFITKNGPENIVVAFRPDQIKSVFAKEFAPTDKLSEATDDWDLGGCWITNRGRVEDCDHKNDRHHSHIALDDFIDFIDPNEENEYDDYCRNAAVDMAYDEGWIRISTRGHRDFSVEWRSEPTAEAKQSIVKTVLSYKQQHFDNYELEVKGTFRQYNDFEMFFRDLRKSLRGDLRESDDSNILYHITPTKNLPTILTHGLVPRIGKRSRRLGETTPAIYFFPDMESVENALMNWLGDEFSDNTRLALLQVSIPPNVDIKSDAGFERHITMPVTPDRIKVLSKSITDVVDVKSLNENAHQPTTFSKEAVIEVIRSCQKKFGEGFLYHGNCGSFAIALSKWMAERFTNVKVGLLAPIVVFNFDGDEALISENAVDYNHVFSLVSLNGKYILFDGSGEVTKQGLLRWHKDTMDWYEECGFDSGPGEGRVINAIGDIHSEAVVSCVESGTDPMMDWTDFYEFLNTGKLTEDSDVRYKNDGVFHDPDNKVVRDKGAWGASHSNSSAITGKSAAIIGADGYKDYNPDAQTLKTLAIKKLTAIANSAGSKEPLYHGFQNRRHVQWQVGSVLTIPLTATSGDLQGSAGYGTRIDPNDNEGPPTVFEFPKGTKICGYSKWDKPDAEDFGHLWSEAIVAGKFRIINVRQVKYDGTWRDDVFLTVVRLEPVEYFNPETGSWTPASKLKEELSYDDLFGDKPVVDSLAAARMQKAIKARGFKPPALLTDDAPERRHIERVAAEHFPSKWEYQYTNWYPEPPFGAVESAGAGYYHTVLIDLPPRRGRPQQDERRIPASRGWFPTEQEVELRWEHDHPQDALSRNIKASLNVPKRPNLRVVESMQPRIELVHEKFSGIDEPDDYVYHVTTEPNARKIFANGFQPNSRAMMTNYGAYSKGKVFFTERPGVRFWQERVEAHAEHNFDDPPLVVVLAVPKAYIQSNLKPDPAGTRDCREQCYYIDKPFK